MIRTVRLAIHSWQSWRLRRTLYRQAPELRYFDEAERAAIRRHAKISHIRAARTATITALLRGNTQ